MEESIAESIFLLQNSAEYILNNIHYLSKMSSSAQHKPNFLGKKQLDGIFKKIVKKFPITQDFYSKENCSEISKISADILQEAQPYYDGLINLYNFKETFVQTLRRMSGFCTIELVSHAHLTIYLLEIITSIIRAILIMKNIDDLVKIIGAYGVAFQSQNNTQEFGFMNVSKFISGYDDPYKRFGEELSFCSQMYETLLSSVVEEFRLRCLDGKQMQTTCYYNLSANSKNMAVPSHCHIPELELYGFNSFYKWFGYLTLIFPSFLSNYLIESSLMLLLSVNSLLPLHRDLYINPGKDLVTLVESSKTLSKKSKDINDNMQAAVGAFITFHKNRRDYLVTALHEARLLSLDQPGILGPKLDRILLLLRLTYESVYLWFLHINCENAKSKRMPNELFDLSILTALNEIFQTRDIIIKYAPIIKRYYAAFIADYDLAALQHISTQQSSGSFELKDNDLQMYEGFKRLAEHFKNNPYTDDFKPNDMLMSMRLDWLRMQLLNATGTPNFCRHSNSCCTVNNMAFHALVLDDLDLLVGHCAPLIDLCFFSSVINTLLHEAIMAPGTKSTISVCIGVYSEFDNFLSLLCPEERYFLAEDCFTVVDDLLQVLGKACVAAFTDFLREYLEVNKTHSVNTVVNIWLKRFCDTKKDVANRLRLPQFEMPGNETILILKDELPEFTRLYGVMQDFCQSLCGFKCIKLLDHRFYPRQAVLPYLEEAILNDIMTLANTSETYGDKNPINCPCKPSVILAHIEDLQKVLSILGGFLDMNLDCLLYSIIYSFSVPWTLVSGVSLSSVFGNWYVDVFLESDFLSGTTLFSPLRRSFISKSSSFFRADEYTDILELRALAKMIGPCGVKHIVDTLNNFICNQMATIKRFMNGFNMQSFETSLNSSTPMDSFFKKDKSLEELCVVLTKMGAALILKSLLMNAMRCVLEDTSYHLHLAFKTFFNKRLSSGEVITRLYNSLGYDTIFDLNMIDALAQSAFSGDVDRILWVEHFPCLLPLIIGYAASRETCEYLPQIEAYTNNLHCVVKVFTEMLPQIFYHYKFNNPKTTEDAMKNLCHNVSILLIRMFNGSLTSNPIKNPESYFVIINILGKDNPFLDFSTVEEMIPSCLIVSSTDKLIRNKFSSRISKAKAPKE